MARSRSWRRAQRERIRAYRYALAKVLWSWSMDHDPEWIARQAR